VLILSPRVTDSRTQNLVFRRPCSFLWFSIVSYNNYGGDSKLCFFTNFNFFGSSSRCDFGCDSLKNAGATYQRLMDEVFSNLMGKCVEIYVDDMIVKSPSHHDSTSQQSSPHYDSTTFASTPTSAYSVSTAVNSLDSY